MLRSVSASESTNKTMRPAHKSLRLPFSSFTPLSPS